MPSKGKQRAARQAKLRQRKRKTRSKTDVVNSLPTAETSSETALPTTTEKNVLMESSVPPTQPRKAEVRIPKHSESTNISALVYPHLSGELRNIGIVASIIIIALIGLTILLG